MKKINNILALLVIALMGLSLTACSSDNLDTNQFLGDVSLNAFGPNPVMRGGTLRFVGSNLDQVASINIPGIGEVTNFEVIRSGVPSELRVAIPKDGPTVGKVVLKTKSDQKIETQNELTYIEGIEVTGFTPAEADPGTIIKIEGDYLNLIYSIAFADGVLVSSSEFKSWDRYFIEVAVPEEAQTGKIELYTADLTIQRTKKEEDELEYQTFITEEALIVGTPTTTKLESPRGVAGEDGVVTAKAGETITLTGKFFNVVSGIKFGSVLLEEFNVNNDGTELNFVVPTTAPSGAINLVLKSGVEVIAGTLETIKPSECVATPSPVKAGTNMTIKGKDLDLVTAVQFTGADAITVESANEVVVTVPETAADKTFQLVMANGETINVEYSLVKPVVTAYNSNPVSAGSELKMTGTNLDLVKSVTFGEATVDLEDGAVSADGTTLTVIVPMDGKPGTPVLTLANSDQVNAPELSINEAVFCYITEMPNFDDETNIPEAGGLFTVPVANADVLTNVLVNGTETQYAYAPKAKSLSISIPENAKAASKLKLVSSNGEIEYDIAVKPNTEIYTTIWSGAWECAGWGGNQELAWGGYDWSTVTAGTTMKIYLRKTNQDAWGCISLRHGNSWGALPAPIPGQYDLEAGDIILDVELTQAIIDDLVANGGLVITGDNYILSKVVLNEHISLEETIWSGAWECAGWGGNQDLAWGGYDWSTVKAGATIRFYYTKITPGVWGCISLRHGDSWGALPDPIPGQYDFPEDAGIIETQFTANILEDLIANGGLVITGDNYVLSKVTIE